MGFKELEEEIYEIKEELKEIKLMVEEILKILSPPTEEEKISMSFL